uniref:Transmembrane protein 126A n=1 Tax=Oryctolagus cuniculus TaxID=9986 RepID=A0A5F9D1Z0_RABIT
MQNYQKNTEENLHNTKNLTILEIRTKKINQLPEPERNLLQHGSTYVGINAVLCGLIANSLSLRVLIVMYAHIGAGLPMAVIPLLTAHVAYKGFLSFPSSIGDLNCNTCPVTWSGLGGLVFGGLHPVFWATPVDRGLAARCQSALLPEKGNILTNRIRISKSVYKDGISHFAPDCSMYTLGLDNINYL